MRKLNKRAHFMLNDAELAALKKKSTEAGMTMSAYLRKRIMETTIRERPNIDWRPLTNRIEALGNEVNEITRTVNEHGVATEYDVKSILGILRQVKAELAFLSPYAHNKKEAGKETK